jgi:hypothetical protein
VGDVIPDIAAPIDWISWPRINGSGEVVFNAGCYFCGPFEASQQGVFLACSGGCGPWMPDVPSLSLGAMGLLGCLILVSGLRAAGTSSSLIGLRTRNESTKSI